MPPVYQQAEHDGAAARRAGEPRDPTPYLPRYGEWRGARSLSDFWLFGYDKEDERIAVEQSRPVLPGEDLWRPVKREDG